MSASATQGGHNKCRASAAAEMGDGAIANWAEKWGPAVQLSVEGIGSPI